MATNSAPTTARYVDAAWPSVQAAVTRGLATGRAAVQLERVAETGTGADGRAAIRLVTAEPTPGSIAAMVHAHLDETYDLCPEPLTLRATRNGVTDASGADSSAAIISWASKAREAELAWLCGWITSQPIDGSESILNTDELDREAAVGARLLLPAAVSRAARSRGVVHLVRLDGSNAALRLPSTFRYVRHADFDVTWRPGKVDEIELELVARVRLTGWDPALAHLYRTVDAKLA